MWKGFCALFKKDCRMLASGKFFLMAIGFLVLYTAYVNLGYIRFMQMPPYNVYLYDPASTEKSSALPVWDSHNAISWQAVVSHKKLSSKFRNVPRN